MTDKEKLDVALEALRGIENHEHCNPLKIVDGDEDGFMVSHSRGHICCASIARAAREKMGEIEK
jgi:hypothetical protein